MRYSSILAAVLLALFLCLACKAHNDADRGNSGPIKILSEQKPRSMDPKRLERLRDGLKRIQLGEKMDSVLAKVGQPDETETVCPKRPHPAEEDRQDLVYDVALVGSSRGNIGDKTVSLSFNHAGKLMSINSNVEGIQSRF